MDVAGVGDAFRHDVHPEVGQRDLAALHVELELAGEGADVAVEPTRELGERAGEAVQLVHRGVAGVATRIVFCGPAPAGVIVVPQPAALVGQVGIVAGRIAPAERLAVDEGGKPGAGWHGESEGG